MAFDQQHLTELGFSGLVPLRSLPPRCRDIPDLPGIYAVTLDARPVTFLAHSVGGRFKRKHPTVPIEVLERKWVDGTETVYVGRASSLRDRLGLLARFGRGDAVGHWGGRYLWQLAALDELRVAWRVERDPVQGERKLLDSFEVAMGALPFANLMRGTRVALAA
jgi:hypothetical protein